MVISFHVPAMRSRHCVRTISSRVSDVPGVRTLEVDLGTRTVRVTGTVDAAAVGAAITDAGYDAEPGDGDVPAGARPGRRRHRPPRAAPRARAAAAPASPPMPRAA